MSYAQDYQVDKTSNTVSSTFYQKMAPESDNYYPLTSNETVFWGKDDFYPDCKCSMQYVRVYLDYSPRIEEQMITLALMDSDSNALLLLFQC